MGSISGVNSNAAMTQIRVKPPARDDSQRIQNLFSKIDTTGQGSFDNAALGAALGASSSSFAITSATTHDFADALFTQMDANGDSKVSAQEFTSTLSMLAGRFAQQPTEGASAQGAHHSGGVGAPPPEHDDAGFTKDQLTAKLSQIGSTNSKRSALMSKVINNFSAADANGDGKVSHSEAVAYDQSTPGTSGTASSAAVSADVANTTDLTQRLMAQIMKLMDAYGSVEKAQGQSQISVSA